MSVLARCTRIFKSVIGFCANLLFFYVASSVINMTCVYVVVSQNTWAASWGWREETQENGDLMFQNDAFFLYRENAVTFLFLELEAKIKSELDPVLIRSFPESFYYLG